MIAITTYFIIIKVIEILFSDWLIMRSFQSSPQPIQHFFLEKLTNNCSFLSWIIWNYTRDWQMVPKWWLFAWSDGYLCSHSSWNVEKNWFSRIHFFYWNGLYVHFCIYGYQKGIFSSYFLQRWSLGTHIRVQHFACEIKLKCCILMCKKTDLNFTLIWFSATRSRSYVWKYNICRGWTRPRMYRS